MNRRELNLSGMFLTLEEFLTANLSSIEDKPLIMSVYADLKANNIKIRSLTELQSVSTKADFEIKSEDKQSLLDTAVKVVDGLKVMAATHNDTRLKVETKLSRWDLSRMRESDMIVRLKQLGAVAMPYAEELIQLSITMEELKSLNSDSDKLLKVTPVIKNIEGKSTQATTELGQTIVDTNKMIRETLDPLMLQFKLMNKTLYGEYLNARKVVDRSAGRAPKETPQK